jgi:uncharacterized protein (TIRG00374 family)
VASRSSTLLRLVVALVITGLVLSYADPAQALDALRRVSWVWLAGAFVLVIADRALMAYRWMALLGASTRPPFWRMLRIFFESSFVGAFLPSVGGDVARAWALSRDGVAGAQSVASVLMDRLLGVVSILMAGAVGLALAPRVFDRSVLLISVAVLSLACLTALLLVFSRTADRMAKSSIGWVRPASLGRMLHRVLGALQDYRGRSQTLVLVLVASIAVQLLRIVQAWMLGRGLGIAAPFELYLACIPIVLLVMMLPISVSGLGTGNVAFVLLFGQSGVSAADAFALSVLFLLLGVAGTLPGGVLYVLPRNAPPGVPGRAQG